MSMNLSLATGAPLTPETWIDFVTRLRHDCVGEGVERHSTRDALFTVEQRKIDTGIDLDCASDRLIYCDDSTWANPAAYLADCDEDEIANLNALAQADDHPSFAEAPESDQWDILENLDGHGVTGWAERWEYVNAHLTRDAADAFIKRKKHDYPKGVRVYVESQYYALEFNTIKEAILSGRLVFSDKEEGTPT